MDPIGDIAVLGSPDTQGLRKRAYAFDEFVNACEALPITDAPSETAAFLLSLDGRWRRCRVHHHDGPLWIFNAEAGIEGGMSGSPIIDANGSAIGVVVTGEGLDIRPDATRFEGGPNPRLSYNLPAWVPSRGVFV